MASFKPRVLSLPSGPRIPTTVYDEPGDPSNSQVAGRKERSVVNRIGAFAVLGGITLGAAMVALAASRSAVRRIRRR